MPDLTARAEEAFLGAIISDPRQLSDLPALRTELILPPFEASEFTDPARRAAWTAISRLTEIAPGARGPEMADLILATSDDPLITRDYLTRLALSAPTPNAAAVYARMVTEARLFRELADNGMPAGNDASWPDDLSARLITSYAANLTAAWSAAADYPAAPSQPPQDERAIREERFLAGLIGQQELGDWIALDPGIFTAPGLREIYQAAVLVDRLGEPADEVTLTWAATRIIAQHDSFAGRVTTPQTLAEVIPPGTIARLTNARVDPLTALETGRDLLADHARAQIDAQASAARGPHRDITAGYETAQGDGRDRARSNGNGQPLLRPPDQQPHYGPQLTQDGN